RVAFPRHREPAGGAPPPARRRQHRGGHRAQPGRDQDRRLDRRPGSRGRAPRGYHHRHGHAGTRRIAGALLDRALPAPAAGAPQPASAAGHRRPSRHPQGSPQEVSPMSENDKPAQDTPADTAASDDGNAADTGAAKKATKAVRKKPRKAAAKKAPAKSTRSEEHTSELQSR